MTEGSATFGDLLRRHRLALGLTQEELAERAQVSPRAISDLERGLRTRPWRDTIQFLAEALKLGAPDRAQLAVAARVPQAATSAKPLAPASPPPAVLARHNLPIQVTSFVGRERELSEIKGLIATTRLLTLTGTGGCGKTRLALQVAADLADAFPDGVWLVELAPLADPALVLPTVAAVVVVREEPGQSIQATLLSSLRARRLLLLLDNCEHVIDACAHVADAILRNCPGIHILVTSREALGIAGEASWRVPSLAPPPVDSQTSLTVLATNEAIRLFVDRAVAIQPAFTLTEQNAPVVAQICWRLDGIPLAIELAATRVKTLSVQQIVGRLDQRFRLLTGGSRTALPRQQTLAALVNWSYDLLTDAERTLFERLSVFAGGFNLESAEAVGSSFDQASAAPPRPTIPGSKEVGREGVLDLLGELVDKSLVVAESGTSGVERYRLLETLRVYGRERLVASGNAETIQRRHAAHYLEFSLESQPHLYGPRQREYLARIDAELDNLRAALRWFLDHDDFSAGAQLLEALQRPWWYHGRNPEARIWFEQFLALPGAADRNALRARTLAIVGDMVSVEGDLVLANRLSAEAIAIAREVGDRRVLARVLHLSAFPWWNDETRERAEEGLALHREIGDRWWIGQSLNSLGRIAFWQGNPALARVYLAEDLAIARTLADQRETAVALEVLGEVALEESESEARGYLEESLALYRELGDLGGVASDEHFLGQLECWYGHYALAGEQYRASLPFTKGWAGTWLNMQSLTGLAVVAARQGDAERALLLAGAGDSLRAGRRKRVSSNVIFDGVPATQPKPSLIMRRCYRWSNRSSQAGRPALHEARDQLCELR